MESRISRIEKFVLGTLIFAATTAILNFIQIRDLPQAIADIQNNNNNNNGRAASTQ